MLFDHCAECQRCCIVETGYPPLEVTLTETEVSKIGSVCIETSCKHLGPGGCTMGESKPFACSLYPLSFNPQSRRFLFDGECPIMPTYIDQLHDDKSEASQHLKAIKKEVVRLEKLDPDFLAKNHVVDVDYFDLIELPLKSSLRGYRK